MKKLFLTFFAVFAALAVGAQVNPERGFVITNAGDTIWGSIELRTNAINARQCTFKAKGEGGYKVYRPGEIAGYRFAQNGKFYVSKRFGSDGACFAEFIMQGILNLYRVESDAEYFYLEDEEGKVTKYTNVSIDDAMAMSNAKALYGAVGKSPKAAKKVRPGEMNIDRIMDVVRTYHHDLCTSNEDCVKFEYDRKSDRSKIRWNVSALGALMWSVERSSGYNFDSGKKGFGIGVGVDVDNSRRANGRLMQYFLNYLYQDVTTMNASGRRKIYDKLHCISLGIGPQFRWGGERSVKFTCRAGLLPTAFIYDENILGNHGWKQVGQFSLLLGSAYGGAGLDFLCGAHSVLLNLDYRCVNVFRNNFLTASVGFRF